MKPLHFFSNHVGGLTTQTVEACAHGFRIRSSIVSGHNSLTVKAKSFIGYPAPFSAGRRNPNSRSAAAMNYGQGPFSLELQDFIVRNLYGRDGIHNINRSSLEDHFGSNPNEVRKDCDCKTNRQFNYRLDPTPEDKNAISSEKTNENESRTRPNIITSGSKGLVHSTIIAGDIK